MVDAARVYESPYESVAPQGPEAIFAEEALEKIFSTISRLRRSAA